VPELQEARAEAVAVVQEVSAPVLRLLRPIPDFIPESGPSALNWMAFNPSNEDRKAANESGNPVRVSVFDWTKTTIAQARAFRSGVPCKPFELHQTQFAKFRDKWSKSPARIVFDELDDPHRSLPGADGHCGIEGLVRADAEKKPDWKARLQDLADRCRGVDGHDENLLATASDTSQ
jgi:hypothetical protein